MLHARLEVVSPRRPASLAPAGAAAEHAAEEIAQVAEVELLETNATGASAPVCSGESPPARGAERVVGAALLGVGEQVVGGLDLLELLLGAVVARVPVRVVLARKLAVGLLDLVVGRVLRDAEHLVGAGHGSLLRDDHPRGTDDLVAEAVAALHDLEHAPLLRVVCRLREHRLVDVRVELPFGLDLLEPLLLERTFAAIARRDGRRRPAPLPRAAPRPRACARDRRARAGALGRAARARARPDAPGRAPPACGSSRSPPSSAAGGRGTRPAPGLGIGQSCVETSATERSPSWLRATKRFSYRLRARSPAPSSVFLALRVTTSSPLPLRR